MGKGLGLAETSTKAELSQLELELGLILSLEDFPGGGGEPKRKYSSAQLGPELGKNKCRIIVWTWSKVEV